MAADTSKVNTMRSHLKKNTVLGIASGITPENVGDYDVDTLLVATGISRDFHNFDPAKLSKLLEAISEPVRCSGNQPDRESQT